MQKGHHKLVSASSQRTHLNFYFFFQSLQWTRHSMVFTHPRCLQMFLNPRVLE